MAQQNLPSMLVDFQLFFDDEAWGGVVNKLTPADIEFKTETQTGSATGGERDRVLPILKPLKPKLTVSDYHPKFLGLIGNPAAKEEPITTKGAIDRDGVTQAVEITMQGDWYKMSMGELSTGGQEANLDIEGTLDIYTIEIDGKEIIHIDIPGKIYRLNGVDQFTKLRKAIGMAAAEIEAEQEQENN